MDNLIHDKLYKEQRFKSQRRYPNEELLRFMGTNYFDKIEQAQREHIKVLELGCGSGANLWMIAKEGFNAYGVDISQEGINLCKKMLQKWNCKADIRIGNAKNLPFENNSFDVIVDVVSLQHIDLDGHGLSLKEAFRCLKNGGLFFY